MKVEKSAFILTPKEQILADTYEPLSGLEIKDEHY